MNTSNRREFLKKAAVSGAAAGAGLTASNLFPNRSEAQGKDFTRLYFRELGSTGYKATEIGFGAMNTRDAELIHAAIDAGINYLDTAHRYMNGANEEIVGTVMKTKRDKVFLVTKLPRGSSADILRTMEISLQRLQTDHVDLCLLHNNSAASEILSEDHLKGFEEIKRKGMTRFIGVSTHQNQLEVIDAALKAKIWEAVLVGYNYTSPPSVGQAIERARKAGLAVIGMKMMLAIDTRRPLDTPAELRKGGMNAAQAALKWVLQNNYIDTTVPGMTAFEHLAQDLDVMGSRMTFQDRKTLIRYARARQGGYCHGTAGCTGCQNQCPKGVKICELNRCVGYVNGYGDPALALENYRDLPSGSRIEACGDCDECQVKCRHGLNLTETVRQARVLFG
jgi:predicted aldo/keto reductase-like oxidoreductase